MTPEDAPTGTLHALSAPREMGQPMSLTEGAWT